MLLLLLHTAFLPVFPTIRAILFPAFEIILPEIFAPTFLTLLPRKTPLLLALCAGMFLYQTALLLALCAGLLPCKASLFTGLRALHALAFLLLLLLLLLESPLFLFEALLFLLRGHATRVKFGALFVGHEVHCFCANL